MPEMKSAAHVDPRKEATLTIKDEIAHLQTMPPDMEVWETCDESGEYWPATVPPGRVDMVGQVKRRGRSRWEETYKRAKGRAVCVLLPPAWRQNDG